MLKIVVIVSALVAIASCDSKRDVLFAAYGGLGSRADFYNEEYLNGGSHSVELSRGACNNLPKGWHKKAKSVDTKGTCIEVCDEIDCGGTCAFVFPSNGEQQLSQIGFARRIVSLKGCFQKRS